MTGRHPDVDQYQIRTLSTDQRDEAIRIPGLTGNLESCSLQQPCYALAQQDIVIGQNNPHRMAGIAKISHPNM